MKKIIVLLSVVVASIKGFFVDESAVSKSKGIRGRITSILTDLEEANEELHSIAVTTANETAIEVSEINSVIESLNASINDSYDNIATAKAEAREAISILDVEVQANSALLRGIDKLVNG